MKPSKDPITSEIRHRLVVPIQTRGNLGKSTEAIARCEWMSQRGVSWKGRDLEAKALKPAASQPSLPKRRTSGVNMENIR